MAGLSLWPFSTAQKRIQCHLFCIYHNGLVAGRLDSELWLPGIADKHCRHRISAVLISRSITQQGVRTYTGARCRLVGVEVDGAIDYSHRGE
jgi:hypothetical protein